MKSLSFIILLFLVACSSLNATVNAEEKDLYILMSAILNINEERHTFTDASGKQQNDSLKLFKELEQVYIRNIEPDLSTKKFSEERLKIVMMFSFYAHERNSAAFLEYLASDLMPIYKANSKYFINIFKELPFLIPANCNRLNRYFGFEGKNKKGKSNFMQDIGKLMDDRLSKEQKQSCLVMFD